MLSVYVGDDWTDELAFGELVGQAITVRVGPAEAPSRATYRFDGVEGVHRLLERLPAGPRPPGGAPGAPQPSREVLRALNPGGAGRGLTRLSGRPAYVYSSAVQRDERTVGALLVVLDARPLAEAEWRLWRYNGIRFLVLVLVLSAIAFLIVRISVVRPLDADAHDQE